MLEAKGKAFGVVDSDLTPSDCFRALAKLLRFFFSVRPSDKLRDATGILPDDSKLP